MSISESGVAEIMPPWCSRVRDAEDGGPRGHMWRVCRDWRVRSRSAESKVAGHIEGITNVDVASDLYQSMTVCRHLCCLCHCACEGAKGKADCRRRLGWR